MKLPLNGRWQVNQSSDKGLGLFTTRNIDFDQQGYLSLSSRTIALIDEDNDADFEVPVSSYAPGGKISKVFTTGGGPFTIDINAIPISASEDGLANQPDGSNFSGGTMFNEQWALTESNDIHSYDGSSWTDQSVTLSTLLPHPPIEMKSNRTLLVPNGNVVKQFSTAYAETTNLTLPAGTKVAALAYNRALVGLVTWNEDGQEAWFYVWDGATTAANYSYNMGSSRAFFVAPYQDGFAFLTGTGELLSWSGAMGKLAGLPSSYRTAELGDIDDTLEVAHSSAVLVERGRILFNISSVCASKNSDQSRYNIFQPSGIWCYDPQVGLYHRNAPSGTKMVTETVPTADVNTTTNVITSTATVPETGTETVYVTSGTVIGGISINVVYYIIKASANTFKLALTRADAVAGTAIDLTGTGNDTQYFIWFPQSDFGQSAVDGIGGMLVRTGSAEANTSAAFFSIFDRHAFGFGSLNQRSVAASMDRFGIVMDRGENRGYVVTQKMFSPSIADTWQKLIVKARGLETEHDKVIVKFRNEEDTAMPVIARSDATKGTWVDANTFTTAADLSDVQVGYEVEFILGAGSGYLAHISSLSEDAGTWTVNIDEDIRNISASDTCYFVVDNWAKMQDSKGNSAMSSATSIDHSEFPISKQSKWIQFKIELRGRGVQIEELELINEPYQKN